MAEEKKKNEIAPSTQMANMLAPAFSKHFGFEPTKEEFALMASYYFGIEKTLIASDGYYKWNQVDTDALKRDLIHYARLGFDSNVPNMLSFMPRYDSKTKKVKMIPIEGVDGVLYKAEKFCDEENKPIETRIELVYETDEVTVSKSDAYNEGDSYIFKIVNPFNRGKIVGGIGFLGFKDKNKNIVLLMSETEILKHKPDKASDKFWGKWKEKMYSKTIAKELFKKIKINPVKMSPYSKSLAVLESMDLENARLDAQEEIQENANNGEIIDIVEEEIEEAETVEEVIEDGEYTEVE